jgi:hypothetical protein
MTTKARTRRQAIAGWLAAIAVGGSIYVGATMLVQRWQPDGAESYLQRCLSTRPEVATPDYCRDLTLVAYVIPKRWGAMYIVGPTFLLYLVVVTTIAWKRYRRAGESSEECLDEVLP